MALVTKGKWSPRNLKLAKSDEEEKCFRSNVAEIGGQKKTNHTQVSSLIQPIQACSEGRLQTVETGLAQAQIQVKEYDQRL